MSSPRVLASLLAVAAAGLLIASCGDQLPSPTGASSVTTPGALQSTPMAFVDMLADPAGPLGTLADPPVPIIYPPGSQPDPWPPGPPPRALPGVPVPEEPTVSTKMHILVEPEPVPHSGVPVPVASCATNHPYTWYYQQKLINDTGLAITFTERENFFDGRFAGGNNEVIQIRANGTVTLTTRWCSGYAKPHHAQTRFKGRMEDGNRIEMNAPWARLLTP